MKKNNFPTPFLEEFENFNWRDLNFNEQLEHFTYSENEQLSPQFSYFSASGQNDQLQSQAFMPHPQYQNNTIVPQNLINLQQLMMVQQKKEFPSQQNQISEQNIKIASPFQNSFSNSQQIVNLGANQNISIQNMSIGPTAQHPCLNIQQQQHLQEDAIMNIKECNQNHQKQQQFQQYQQSIIQPDIHTCSDISMTHIQDKCRSKEISLEQHQVHGDCTGHAESIQIGQSGASQINQDINNNSKLKSHSTLIDGNTVNPQLSLLQFNFKEEKTYENEVGKKRRGRRKIEDDQYYAITNDKIQEWEYILQNSKNLSKKDKKILRNRISAQKSRNKKKEEFGNLNSQIDVLKDRYRQLFEILEENTCGTCKENIINCLQGGQQKRQKIAHDHSNTQINHSGSGKGLGKGKNFMKMMLGFVAMVGVIAVAADPLGVMPTSMNGKSIMAYEKPKGFLQADQEYGISSSQFIKDDFNLMQPQLMTIDLTSNLDNGKIYQINVSEYDSILEIKKSIQITQGIPIQNQRIFNNQSELQNDSTLGQIISAENVQNATEHLKFSITINNNFEQ